MKIKFIKEYRAIPLSGGIDNDWGCYKDEVKDVHDDQGQWLIDNGFAEEVKESGWWKPKLGDIYYVVYPDGLIASCTWDGCTVDENRFSNGACLKTEEAAYRYRDYLKAIATVRQDEGVLTPEEICRFYESESGNIFVITTNFPVLAVSQYENKFLSTAAGAIYFDTFDRAKASLDKHLDAWKIISNYDWSRE